ncbi:MAG: hypothetical protein WDA16_08295 [Candidatus Thermoplasmatota archaeon]
MSDCYVCGRPAGHHMHVRAPSGEIHFVCGHSCYQRLCRYFVRPQSFMIDVPTWCATCHHRRAIVALPCGDVDVAFCQRCASEAVQFLAKLSTQVTKLDH